MQRVLCFWLAGLAILAGLIVAQQAGAHVPKSSQPVLLTYARCSDAPDDPSILGCYFIDAGGLPHIYVADNDPLTLPHELGHLFDDFELTDADRQDFTYLVHRLGDPWFANESIPVGEVFAETYARCWQHTRWSEFTSYDVTFTSHRQFRVICQHIWAYGTH